MTIIIVNWTRIGLVYHSLGSISQRKGLLGRKIQSNKVSYIFVQTLHQIQITGRFGIYNPMTH